MGIVRRCGRPPRPAPLIQKSTRDRVVVRLAPIAAAVARAGAGVTAVDPPRAASRELEAAATARIAAIAFTGGGDRGDRRPRIPAIPVLPVDRRGDAARDHRACDEVICSCRDHAIITAE